MVVSIIEPPALSKLREIVGPPEDLLGYVLLILVGKAGWDWIESKFAVGKGRHHGIEIIQESGPGDVQEAD